MYEDFLKERTNELTINAVTLEEEQEAKDEEKKLTARTPRVEIEFAWKSFLRKFIKFLMQEDEGNVQTS